MFISGCEPDPGDGSGRAYVLAEERSELEAEGQHQDEKGEHDILEVTKIFVELEFVFLEERNLIKEILQEPERAQEAAYRAAQ